jgi:hypothetical protein
MRRGCARCSLRFRYPLNNGSGVDGRKAAAHRDNRRPLPWKRRHDRRSRHRLGHFLSGRLDLQRKNQPWNQASTSRRRAAIRGGPETEGSSRDGGPSRIRSGTAARTAAPATATTWTESECRLIRPARRPPGAVIHADDVGSHGSMLASTISPRKVSRRVIRDLQLEVAPRVVANAGWPCVAARAPQQP